MQIEALDQLPTAAPDAAEQFLERASEIINAGTQAVMLSIGHRSGLFDTMAQMPPATSAEVAEAAGLNERYVREWMASLVTAGIIDYQPESACYHLPPAHAACLTRGAPLGNVAVFAQFVALLGEVQDQTLRLLESGKGTAYQDYPCFHDIMAEDSAQSVVASLIDTVLPLVDGMEQRLRQGIDVLDAGCGKGLALIELARHFPQSRFVGYDLCADTIEAATHKAAGLGLGNVTFAVQDMALFDARERFDFITTFDAVHDQKQPAALIRKLQQALKPGGVYLMQDIGGSAKLENNIDFPMASLLYAMSLSHCTPISIGQGGEGLGTMWGWETAQAMLEESGFQQIHRQVFEHDPLNVWFVSRKG